MATYAPRNYLEAENGLGQLQVDAGREFQNVERAIEQIRAAERALQNVSANAPLGWAELNDYIQQERAANPSDEQWQQLDGRRGKIITDTNSGRQRVSAILQAIDGISKGGGRRP